MDFKLEKLVAELTALAGPATASSSSSSLSTFAGKYADHLKASIKTESKVGWRKGEVAGILFAADQSSTSCWVDGLRCPKVLHFKEKERRSLFMDSEELAKERGD